MVIVKLMDGQEFKFPEADIVHLSSGGRGIEVGICETEERENWQEGGSKSVFKCIGVFTPKSKVLYAYVEGKMSEVIHLGKDFSSP